RPRFCTRSQGRDDDDPDRVRAWQRPGQGRLGCEPRPAGRRYYGGHLLRQSACFEADRGTPRHRAQRFGRRLALEPEADHLGKSALRATPCLGGGVRPSQGRGDRANAELELSDAQAAARALDVRFVVVRAAEDAEIDTAFAELARQGVAALLVAGDATCPLSGQSGHGPGSTRDCGPCPLKPKCTPNMTFRKIPRDVHEDARDATRALMGTPE